MCPSKKGHSLPPACADLQIASLRSTVSAYAFELIVAQFAMAQNYTAERVEKEGEEGEEDDDVWHQQYVLTPLRIDDLTKYEFDDEGNVATDAPEDFGLCDYNVKRVASITGCSCQFETSSGLDVCRHRLNRCMALIDHIPRDQLCNMVYWQVFDANEEAEATRALHIQPVPKLFTLPSADVPLPKRSWADRHAVLLTDARNLAQLGAESEERFKLVEQGLQKLYSQVTSGRVCDEPAEGEAARSTAEPARSSGQARPPRPRLSSEPFSGTDGLDLQAALGDEYELTDEPIDENDIEQFELMLSKEVIAYKWKGAGKGGWALGLLTVLPDSEKMLTEPFGHEKQVNCKVYYFKDQSVAEHALYLENYVAQPGRKEVEMHYWVKCDRRPLTDDVDRAARAGYLNAPAKKQRKGRHESARKAPVAGPTSRQSHQARKK
jgi:hypothetical protein